MTVGAVTQLEIAERLAVLEARVAIRELADAYCSLVDDRDWERLGALFISAARFNDVQGRQSIADFFRTASANYSFSLHYVRGVSIDEISAEHAHGRVTGHAELRIGADLIVVGPHYSDTYALEDGRWLFASRDITYAYRMPFEDYGRRLGVAETITSGG